MPQTDSGVFPPAAEVRPGSCSTAAQGRTTERGAEFQARAGRMEQRDPHFPGPWTPHTPSSVPPSAAPSEAVVFLRSAVHNATAPWAAGVTSAVKQNPPRPKASVRGTPCCRLSERQSPPTATAPAAPDGWGFLKGLSPGSRARVSPGAADSEKPSGKTWLEAPQFKLGLCADHLPLPQTAFASSPATDTTGI